MTDLVQSTTLLTLAVWALINSNTIGRLRDRVTRLENR